MAGDGGVGSANGARRLLPRPLCSGLADWSRCQRLLRAVVVAAGEGVVVETGEVSGPLAPNSFLSLASSSQSRRRSPGIRRRPCCRQPVDGDALVGDWCRWCRCCRGRRPWRAVQPTTVKPSLYGLDVGMAGCSAALDPSPLRWRTYIQFGMSFFRECRVCRRSVL